ncbi:MAG: RNA polymerase sigma factor [Acidobacteriota bacterium]
MDINIILRRIDRGDRSAFADLVDCFQRPLFGYLGRMGLHQGQAEEVAQETFLRAWQRMGDYDPRRAEFSTWLFTIARHLAINELTRPSSKHEQAWSEHEPEAVCEQSQPSHEAMAKQQRQQVQHALRQLPHDDRSALALAYYEELDMASIARIEGCTVGAIKVRLHRAKQRLRQLLENT